MFDLFAITRYNDMTTWKTWYVDITGHSTKGSDCDHHQLLFIKVGKIQYFRRQCLQKGHILKQDSQYHTKLQTIIIVEYNYILADMHEASVMWCNVIVMRCNAMESQSCPRVTFHGPDPTRQNVDPTLPDPRLLTKSLTQPDPRPDPSPICIVFIWIIIY